MLRISMLPDEYLTVSDNIVVQLTRIAGGRAYLAVEAPRKIPVLRGTVFERNGGKRPECLTPPSKKPAKHHRDWLYRWNDDRERAVRAMQKVLDQLSEKGAAEEAQALRAQLERIIPTYWEEEVVPQTQNSVSSGLADR